MTYMQDQTLADDEKGPLGEQSREGPVTRSCDSQRSGITSKDCLILLATWGAAAALPVFHLHLRLEKPSRVLEPLAQVNSSNFHALPLGWRS